MLVLHYIAWRYRLLPSGNSEILLREWTSGSRFLSSHVPDATATVSQKPHYQNKATCDAAGFFTPWLQRLMRHRSVVASNAADTL
jgi:hypothetical protein